ncbi:hypothetical protein K2173_023920 [Erythroxylum novogranatense]|uniref:non-specific serine/threonine protein kinase n=1 Tax=Erythroxylum novogranatense TaxID=1862640 RepID=A0AAV8TPR9_9ROSI|nr:hypothetical protein K2173_023920 [Erythroxylum novogranatense]
MENQLSSFFFRVNLSNYGLLSILLFSLTIPHKVQTSMENTSFSFTEFSEDMTELKFEADSYVGEAKVVELTSSESSGSVGRLTYRRPLQLWDSVSRNLADFNTHFSFSINSVGRHSRAHGFAFFLAPNGSQIPPNSGRGYLALCSNSSSTNFVAVEFDTHQDDWDPIHMPTHVGIDLDSMNSVATTNCSCSDIYDGGKADAWIAYKSSTKILSVKLISGCEDNWNSYTYELRYTVDLRVKLPEWITVGFSAATVPDLLEHHTIHSWDLSLNLQLPDDETNQTTSPVQAMTAKRKRRPWLWAIPVICGIPLLVSGFVWFLCWMNRRKRKDGFVVTDHKLQNEAGARSFSYEELLIATSNFADARLLGRGGFGFVYEGLLQDTNSKIAVKKIVSESTDFTAEEEVRTISRLRHRNLVQLIGWCRERQELLIVYEFMPNKSLDFLLFSKRCTLTWETRNGIALGVATALHYLQELCDQCVLHRDVKSSNVLLDSNFNAKLGDFGLARFVNHDHSSYTTKLLVGTRGYVAPEYVESSRASKESDVYSFGIVALEIASGKRAIFNDGVKTGKLLVEWVWEQYGRGQVIAAADPLLVVGLACAHPDYRERPSIGEAIDMLKTKAELPCLPLEMPELTNMFSSRDNTSSCFESEISRASNKHEKGQIQLSGTSSGTIAEKGQIQLSGTSSGTIAEN